MQINRVRLSATLFSVSLYLFFSALSLSFNTIFPADFSFWPSFFLPLNLLVMHLDQNIF